MSEDNNKIDELEKRIKTSEDQIKALNNDIDAWGHVGPRLS